MTRLYLAAAVAIALAGAWIGGHHSGVVAERKVWELKQAQAESGAAKALAAELKTAMQSAAKIAEAIKEGMQSRIEMRTKTSTVVKEVTRYVHDTPSLAVPLPDPVVRLRAEQVSDSARAAAEARDVIRIGPGTVSSSDR